MLTPDDITRARDTYDTTVARADDIRALTLARADAEGMPQTQIIRATGYSRETVRRITRHGQDLIEQMAAANPVIASLGASADRARRAIETLAESMPATVED